MLLSPWSGRAGRARPLQFVCRGEARLALGSRATRRNPIDYCRKTTKRLIEYPNTPPTNTSERKCDDHVIRENPTNPVKP